MRISLPPVNRIWAFIWPSMMASSSSVLAIRCDCPPASLLKVVASKRVRMLANIYSEGLAILLASTVQKVTEIVTQKEKYMIKEDMLATIEATAEKIRSVSSGQMTLIGQMVDETVKAAGGGASAEFAVTERLTRLVPYGARHLRHLRRFYLRTKLIEEAAIKVYEMLVGDPAADIVSIGSSVNDVISDMIGATAVDAVKPLADRLSSLGELASPSFLLRCRIAFQIARLGDAELAKLIPAQYPATALPCLFQLTKGRLPWVAKDLVLKAARSIVQSQPQGKRQIEKIVADVLARESRKNPKTPAVFASWYIPPKSERGSPEMNLRARIHKAA